MPDDATTRFGGAATVTATAPPRATPVERAAAVPTVSMPTGFAARGATALRSPWSRLSLLLVLLAAAGACVLLFKPHEFLADGWPPEARGPVAVVLFAVGYGIVTVAFVPRPLLNLAAGALFGSAPGVGAALAGTVIGAGIAFALGRTLGRQALRPLLRGRLLKAADQQLSAHGFRAVLALRLFPGVPFWAVNYSAAVSRMGYAPFLLATALGSVPNTVAYVVAGARASQPTSPVFLISVAAIALPGLAGTLLAWRKRHHLRRR